jgi:hypothetical protein
VVTRKAHERWKLRECDTKLLHVGNQLLLVRDFWQELAAAAADHEQLGEATVVMQELVNAASGPQLNHLL